MPLHLLFRRLQKSHARLTLTGFLRRRLAGSASSAGEACDLRRRPRTLLPGGVAGSGVAEPSIACRNPRVVVGRRLLGRRYLRDADKAFRISVGRGVEKGVEEDWRNNSGAWGGAENGALIRGLEKGGERRPSEEACAMRALALCSLPASVYRLSGSGTAAGGSEWKSEAFDGKRATSAILAQVLLRPCRSGPNGAS
ncbi:hypothetical protein VUR80DRAFT_4239 [Thermomyces stellatus]